MLFQIYYFVVKKTLYFFSFFFHKMKTNIWIFTILIKRKFLFLSERNWIFLFLYSLTWDLMKLNFEYHTSTSKGWYFNKRGDVNIRGTSSIEGFSFISNTNSNCHSKCQIILCKNQISLFFSFSSFLPNLSPCFLYIVFTLPRIAIKETNQRNWY